MFTPRIAQTALLPRRHNVPRYLCLVEHGMRAIWHEARQCQERVALAEEIFLVDFGGAELFVLRRGGCHTSATCTHVDVLVPRTWMCWYQFSAFDTLFPQT